MKVTICIVDVQKLGFSGLVQILRNEYKAFGNIFCNSQKSFHTSSRSSDSNNRGYQPFFKLNNGICIYKKS